MIIFWKGLGILVAIAGFSCFLAAEVITRSVTKDVTYYRTHPLPKLGGAVLGAALAYGTTKLLEKWNAPRAMIDKRTGKEVLVGRKDSFFFVPAKYIPYAVLIIGLIVAFTPR